MERYRFYSADQIEVLFLAKIKHYFANKQEPKSGYFYFEGQDRLTYTSIHEAMTSLYHSLDNEQSKRNFIEVVRRIYKRFENGEIPVYAMIDFVLFSASEHLLELMVPVAEASSSFAGDKEERFALFGTCLQIFKGAAFHPEAIAAYDLLVTSVNFPFDPDKKSSYEATLQKGKCPHCR
jgi:hypothetical protein